MGQCARGSNRSTSTRSSLEFDGGTRMPQMRDFEAWRCCTQPVHVVFVNIVGRLLKAVRAMCQGPQT